MENEKDIIESLQGLEHVPEKSVYPKYQWSMFAGEGKNEQFVVRANDMNDFKIAVKAIRDALKSVSQPQEQTFVPDTLTATCEAHGVVMKQAISKKNNKPYWYHDSSEGARCFGKGYMPKN